MSKLGSGRYPRISLREICLLLRRHPASRWHELNIRLLCGTCEPVVPMIKEKSKRRPLKDESTEAENRDGMTRSSDEVSVIGMERRGNIIR
jgi:hypothetical protein